MSVLLLTKSLCSLFPSLRRHRCRSDIVPRFIEELVNVKKEGWWVPISAPSAFQLQAPDYFSLQEIFPALAQASIWSKVDTYRGLPVPVEFYKKANWAYLGVPNSEPQFASPRAYYKASSEGIQGLDYDVPTGIMTRADSDALQSRKDRTPMAMNAKYFKGVTFPSTTRGGTKRPPPSSSSSSSSSSAAAAADSDSDESDSSPSDSSDSSSSSSDSSSSSSEESDSDDAPSSSSSNNDPMTIIMTTLADNPSLVEKTLSAILSSTAYKKKTFFHSKSGNNRVQLWVKIPPLGPRAKRRQVRTYKLPMRTILECLGGGDVSEGGLCLARASLKGSGFMSDNLLKIAQEEKMSLTCPLTPPQYLAYKVIGGIPEHSARDAARFLKGAIGLDLLPPHREVAQYLASVDVGVHADMHAASYTFPTEKVGVTKVVNMWSVSPALAFFEIVLKFLQVSEGKLEDFGWEVDGTRQLLAVHNTDKGGVNKGSTKTLMSAILSDSQEGQMDALRLMTYQGPDDYAHLRVMMPNIIPGLEDLDKTTCVVFTLKTGQHVLSFAPKHALPLEATLLAAVAGAEHPNMEGPRQSFYNSCNHVESSSALKGVHDRVMLGGHGALITDLRWGLFECPLSSNIAGLDAIASVAYFDIHIMYGGDLKFIFDLEGRCNGSPWHCFFGDWMRTDPLTRKCNPITPELLATWTLGKQKCCHPDTPRLHNLPRSRRVPCILHHELGVVPYNIEAMPKFFTELCTAGYDAQKQAQVAKLASLGQKLAEVLSLQAETSQAWIVVSAPYTKAKELLAEQEAEQSAAQAQYRSNYTHPITVLKSKLRRYQAEVDELTAAQADQAAKVLQLNQDLDDARLVTDHEALALCDWIQALMQRAMAAVGSIPQVYFGGTALVGNDCKRILGQAKKFLGILLEAITDRAKQMFTGTELEGRIKSIDEKFALWVPLFGTLDKFFALANSKRRFTDQQLDAMDECVPVIRGLWVHLYGDLTSAPPKIHEVLDHVMDFARKYRFFVHAGEQNGEKDHSRDNRHTRQFSSLQKQYKKFEQAKAKLRLIEADPGMRKAAKEAAERTKRRKKGGTSKKQENDEKKKEIKTESRDCAVAAGRAVLLRLAASQAALLMVVDGV